MNTIATLVLMTVSWFVSSNSNNDPRTGAFAVLTTREACEYAVSQTQKYKPVAGSVTVSCAPYDGKAAEVVKP